MISLQRRDARDDLRCSRGVDPDAAMAANRIVDTVRVEGREAVVRYARRFDDYDPREPLVLDSSALEKAFDETDESTRELLRRSAIRIESFAQSQREALHDVSVDVPGGRAGHRVLPLDAVGCYAPSGRYPLVSSVLMTAIPARIAGVRRIVLATPRPDTTMLAAARIAGIHEVLVAGGAHGIAALGYGFEATEFESFEAVDAICGPGNAYVTAAKFAVSRDVRIDMLAGPSELVVLADATADAELVAADLLAQAEHDSAAVPILVTTSASLADRVDAALARQIVSLPTERTARASLENNGAAVLCKTHAEAIRATNRIAPEHLQVFGDFDVDALRHCGALFVGQGSAEVFGDYAVGPNHTLPTGSSARYRGGLSVLDFVKITTWLEIEPGESLIAETANLARLEGLEAHARAAEIRMNPHGRT